MAIFGNVIRLGALVLSLTALAACSNSEDKPDDKADQNQSSSGQIFTDSQSAVFLDLQGKNVYIYDFESTSNADTAYAGGIEIEDGEVRPYFAELDPRDASSISKVDLPMPDDAELGSVRAVGTFDQGKPWLAGTIISDAQSKSVVWMPEGDNYKLTVLPEPELSGEVLIRDIVQNTGWVVGQITTDTNQPNSVVWKPEGDTWEEVEIDTGGLGEANIDQGLTTAEGLIFGGQIVGEDSVTPAVWTEVEGGLTATDLGINVSSVTGMIQLESGTLVGTTYENASQQVAVVRAPSIEGPWEIVPLGLISSSFDQSSARSAKLAKTESGGAVLFTEHGQLFTMKDDGKIWTHTDQKGWYFDNSPALADIVSLNGETTVATNQGLFPAEGLDLEPIDSPASGAERKGIYASDVAVHGDSIYVVATRDQKGRSGPFFVFESSDGVDWARIELPGSTGKFAPKFFVSDKTISVSHDRFLDYAGGQTDLVGREDPQSQVHFWQQSGEQWEPMLAKPIPAGGMFLPSRTPHAKGALVTGSLGVPGNPNNPQSGAYIAVLSGDGSLTSAEPEDQAAFDGIDRVNCAIQTADGYEAMASFDDYKAQKVLSSVDGLTWVVTSETSTELHRWNGVCRHGNGETVFVTSKGQEDDPSKRDSIVVRSKDGETWNEQTVVNHGDGEVRQSAFVNDQLVLVGDAIDQETSSKIGAIWYEAGGDWTLLEGGDQPLGLDSNVSFTEVSYLVEFGDQVVAIGRDRFGLKVWTANEEALAERLKP